MAVSRATTQDFFFVLLTILSLIYVESRPLVRNIKDQKEFEALLKHHAKNTGLPVVADFFSESCGPCRMMAPIFKKVAKEYEGRAVFVKIDTARNRQLQSTYRVNSIPTFIFFADGKRKKDFAGAGEHQLKQYTREIVAEAEKLNIRLTLESLTDFYAQYDATKSESSIKELYGKCAKMSSSAYCDGGPATDLATKLQKKYKSKPVLSKKSHNDKDDAGGGQKEEAKAQPEKEKKKASRSSRSERKQEKQQPNLELATLDELEQAVAARRVDLGMPPVVEVTSLDSNDDYDEDDYDEDEEDDEMTKKMWERTDEVQKVVIIGSGPAGLATAVYAARAGLNPVVVAPPFGGQLMGKGVDVENFPGLMGQTGPGVVNLMLDQAASFGTTFEEHLVTAVDLRSSPKRVITNVSTLLAHTVVVATGADSRWLGVPGEWEFRGGGVSTCATCDGFLFRDKPVVVIGGGDTAMEDALVLARTSSSVTLIHRRDTFTASYAMATRVRQHPKINIMWNSSVLEFQGSPASGTEGEDDYEHQRLTGVTVRTTNSADPTTISCAAAFVAIGHIPNTKLFAGQLDMGSDGYVHIQHGTSTSLDGVFAAGDVADHVYRQAITSAGSGAMAALDAERWLSARGLGDDEGEGTRISSRDEL